MKKQHYTLIEMLVTVAVIAILAGIAMGAYSGIQRKAMLNRAAAECAMIQLAIKNYEAEYLSWPTTYALTGSATIYEFGPCPTSSSGWKDWNDFGSSGKTTYDAFFTVLTGISYNSSTKKFSDFWAPNSKKIRFLDFPSSVIKPGTNQGHFLDPWGKPYCIRIDNSGNNRIDDIWLNGASSNTIQILSSIAVYTKEGKAGENTNRFATSWGGVITR